MSSQDKLEELIREYAKHISSAQSAAFFVSVTQNKSKLFRYCHSSLARYGVYEFLIHAKLHNKSICTADFCKQIGASRQAVTAILQDYLAEGWAECETVGRRKYYRATDVLVDSFLLKMAVILRHTTTDEIMDLKHRIKTFWGEANEHILP